MRKIKAKKGENEFTRNARVKGELGAVIKTGTRKFVEENEKYAIYTIVGSVQVHLEEFKKYFELLTENQVKKLEKLEKSCFGYLDRIKEHYSVTEENVKVGFQMYLGLMKYYNKRQKPLVDLNENYQEEKDAKRLYVELNYAVKIIEASLTDKQCKIKEEVKKYYSYWNLQARAVINILEKDIESNTRFSLDKVREEYQLGKYDNVLNKLA